jgi:transposase-like protein
VKHESWIKEVVSAFLAGETLRSLCKRLGGSPNTIRQVLKDNLGEEKFEAIRDRNDPKKSIATEAEILTSFHTDEPFKEIAARLNMSPNTLRNRWITAFGKEAFDARSKRFHSEAGIRAGFARKGKKYLSEETIRVREVSRGVDRRCPVCDVGCVGDQALKNHMSRFGDEAHKISLKILFEEQEILKWKNLKEGIDYVVCKECGLRGGNLTHHLYLHGLDIQTYRKKWPEAAVWSAKAISRHHESLLESSTEQAYSWTVEDLKPFADETGAIIVAKAAIGLGAAPITILHYCRKLGLSTRNKLAWQRLVLDKVAEVLGSKYKWEWSDSRLINSDTGRPYNYDGYFPDHNLIIEAHGDQHFRFSESWHGTVEEFHRQRAVDESKKKLAQDLGFKIIVVRQTDPVHDDAFWTALIGGEERLRFHLTNVPL